MIGELRRNERGMLSIFAPTSSPAGWNIVLAAQAMSIQRTEYHHTGFVVLDSSWELAVLAWILAGSMRVFDDFECQAQLRELTTSRRLKVAKTESRWPRGILKLGLRPHRNSFPLEG
jgi:hypothetical protein